MSGMSTSIDIITPKGDDDDEPESNELETLPVMTFSQQRLIEEAKRAIDEKGKREASLVIIGHVDAGKSTLFGRLLYELGELAERQKVANERASEKIGKASFSWAWNLDQLTEERERGVTMDITQTKLPLPHVDLTILDAPGHRDFVPNLISGASQADTALLVVDAGRGEFEAGFGGGGQSREHIILVRSMGVTSLIVAINKLDTVEWSEERYNEICTALLPFFVQSNYQASNITFVPCAAMSGTNLTKNDSAELKKWYKGPTIADLLDLIVPPSRNIDAPVRIPIANVFRGGTNSATLCISGRVLTGVTQVGERLRILPGEESAIIKKIEVEEETLPWAAAGANVTMQLGGVERSALGVGSVLCPPTHLVPLATKLTVRAIFFEMSLPITPGASVELFHQSREIPAVFSKLLYTCDRATGAMLKPKPRVLTKNASAMVEISLRPPTHFVSAKPTGIPIETFATNKLMGRVVLRRNGETIGAGIVESIIE